MSSVILATVSTSFDTFSNFIPRLQMESFFSFGVFPENGKFRHEQYHISVEFSSSRHKDKVQQSGFDKLIFFKTQNPCNLPILVKVKGDVSQEGVIVSNDMLHERIIKDLTK